MAKRKKKTAPALAYLRTSSAANIGADKDSEKRQRAAIEAVADLCGHGLSLRGSIDGMLHAAILRPMAYWRLPRPFPAHTLLESCMNCMNCMRSHHTPTNAKTPNSSRIASWMTLMIFAKRSISESP